MLQPGGSAKDDQMTADNFKSEFDAAMTAFLNPVLEAVADITGPCRVFMVMPEDPEASDSFELAREELENYLRFTIGQGFFIGIRVVAGRNGRRVELLSWEGASPANVDRYWPASNGEVTASWVWTGHPPAP